MNAYLMKDLVEGRIVELRGEATRHRLARAAIKHRSRRASIAAAFNELRPHAIGEQPCVEVR